MIERLTLSSIAGFVDLARKHPSLLNVGTFNLLKPAVDMKQQGGCACNRKPGAEITAYRPQFEASLAMLKDSDKERLKTILNAKIICYYQKNEKGQLKQICF